MASPNTPQLDYAPAPPKPRRWMRIGALFVLAAAITFGGYRWGPDAWRQAQILYWQRQCMEYSPPPDTVVYEEDPAAAARLLAQAAAYHFYTLHRGSSTQSAAAVNAAAAHPHCLDQLTICTAQPGMLPAIFIGRLGGLGAIAFLHERQSLAGHRRLLVVTYAPETDTFTASFLEGYNYSADAITPATLSSPVAQAQRIDAIDVISSAPRTPPLVRMYAGQPDPAGPAHFTIRYQMWGQEDVLDGRLNDDDSVTLTPRHTPTQP